MSRVEKSNGKVFWPGNPVPAEAILEYFKEYCQPEKLSGRILYGSTDPQAYRTVENLFTFRIGIYHDYSGKYFMRAVYDGVKEMKELRDGDIFLGGYNALSSIVSHNSEEPPFGNNLSIIFHLHHIRILYGSYSNGKLFNQYYHTPKPASGTLLLMVRTLDSVVREVGCPREERCRFLLIALMKQLSYELEQSIALAPAVHNPLAIRIKDFMDHNYQSNINCSTVCDILNINRSYASSLFREEFGMTMIEYLYHLRMEAAKFLLSSEEHLKIDDIANYCGFDDTSYFIRVFRQENGVTPAKFRSNSKSGSS